MLAIFLKTLPFFALIGLGYGAARTRFFPPEAVAWLTRFVFYFALSAMLFRFAANLTLEEVLDARFLGAYVGGTFAIYLIALTIALARGQRLEMAAMEAHAGITANVGFLGLPMLALLLGPEAIGPNMLVLSADLVVFGSLIVVIVSASRDGRVSPAVLKSILLGLLRNPMIVSIVLGLAWASSGLTIPQPADEFLRLLSGAATPCALFVIGASLATKSAERLAVAGWISFVKLVLHPLGVAIAALWIFHVERFAASVMISAAALPVAGNVFILAQHYGIAPQRISAAILISTICSILTIPFVIAMVAGS